MGVLLVIFIIRSTEASVAKGWVLIISQIPGMQVPPPAPQLTKVLAKLRHTFVVADATLPDCPLVFASEG
jgi:hypothetical protein